MYIKVYNDVAEPWQINFQEEATPIQAGIIDFHNIALYYLIIVWILVIYGLLVRIYSNRGVNWYRNLSHSTTIELIWTILPGVILVFIAIPSLKLLYALDDIYKPLVTLKASGYQWYWNYEINDIEGLNVNFDSYTKSFDDLDSGELRLLDVDNRVFLPIHSPIRLLITAQDVIHSFFVPSLGVKIDALPGRINHASLFLLRKGVFYGQCTELCGQDHGGMSIVIEGVDTPDYLSWLTTFA